MAAVLQGLATANEPSTGGVDPALLLRLARQPVFLAALTLNLAGFGLHVVALRSLPLFLVQAVIASSVAVTAVLSVRVFAVPLTLRQWGAVAAVVAGLALLAPTATSSDAVDPGAGAPLVLLATVVLAAVLSVGAGRLPPAPAAPLLGLLGGACFGVVAVSARLLPDLTPRAVLSAPVAYVLVLAGAVAFLLYSTAMQRGSVTTATAALVITQTGLPALVGVLLLGDRVRAGLTPLAFAGFALAVLGALGLARVEAGVPGVNRPARRAVRRAAG